jgi:hypothetical protein
MAKKYRLIQSIYSILKHNLDGPFEIQNARKYCLYQAAEDLLAGGYKLHHIKGIKQKHVMYLTQFWKSRDIGNATLKNRMAHIRWLVEKLNKPNMVSSSDALGIGRRQYVTKDNKALSLENINLNKISNPYVYVQVHLQRHLGLRREEAIKLKP